MKNLRTLMLLIAFVAVISSCKKDKIVDGVSEPETTMSTEDAPNYNMCTILSPDGTTPRGATIKAKQWPNRSIIKVSLNGSTLAIRNKVIQYASEWEKYANIDFQFVTNDRTAPIRVSFGATGHWSYMGTDAKLISSRNPTMNLQFTNANTDEDIRRVATHEFGHALGMIHEHQHPNVNIPWDKPLVYDYYARTQGWDKAKVDNNLFATYTQAQTNFSAYDPTSIMHYPVEEELTIGAYAVGWNTDLSATDKAFIAAVYPR
ncbi:peptidase M12 [Pedobacter polaris]|uniref:Peptidase M12 n=1 Tax=Pedobacter polaris TaxID=2571273 RepID=A0A4U1CXQ7_9SPHI|nr:M12 family metallopeptidase [Pedobacter polaris]TKC13205.1 peptidase M12 [Pedobacter polaris]